MPRAPASTPRCSTPTRLPKWKVPAGMTCRVHAFDPREGGEFRVSLTYTDRNADTRGKTTAITDAYHGRLLQLVPDQKIVELLEFETADRHLRGQMSITTTLTDDAAGGTDLVAVHDRLPPGLSPAQNEAGWRAALAKLAALLE